MILFSYQKYFPKNLMVSKSDGT